VEDLIFRILLKKVELQMNQYLWGEGDTRFSKTFFSFFCIISNCMLIYSQSLRSQRALEKIQMGTILWIFKKHRLKIHCQDPWIMLKSQKVKHAKLYGKSKIKNDYFQKKKTSHSWRPCLRSSKKMSRKSQNYVPAGVQVGLRCM